MKRRDLESHMVLHGCYLHHHGGSHDIWINPITARKAPVPRHNEIKTPTARGICRSLGIPMPPGK
jgi:hypothetical protein